MNQKHVEITPELYSEMLDEVIRLKQLNAELLAALKAIEAHWASGNFSRLPSLWLPMQAAITNAEKHR